MMLAKVIGTVVCTVKYPTLEGRKLLLLQPVNKDGVARGKTLVGIDAVGAGVGETVYWCRGREAALAFDHEVVSDASIVGIVDEINVARVSDPRAHDETASPGATGPACTAIGPVSTVAPASTVVPASGRVAREHLAPAQKRGRR
jgi:bacterial microcompartment shell vertex protein